MKHSTEYLFDKPRSYFEPEVTALAQKKINAAIELKAELAHIDVQNMSFEMKEELHTRYRLVDESKQWWEEILYEA